MSHSESEFLSISGEESNVENILLESEVKERENAVVGENVELWLHLRDRETQQPILPHHINPVKLYNEDPRTISLDGSQPQPIETLPPTPISVGSFMVNWQIPISAKAKRHYDLWKVQINENGPEVEILQKINVNNPAPRFNDETVHFNDFKISLVTTELQRDAQFIIEFILVEPKNILFPPTEVRIYNIDAPHETYERLTTFDRRGQIILDTSNFVAGVYLAQLRFRWGDGLFKTRTYGMRLYDFNL